MLFHFEHSYITCNDKILLDISSYLLILTVNVIYIKEKNHFYQHFTILNFSINPSNAICINTRRLADIYFHCLTIMNIMFLFHILINFHHLELPYKLNICLTQFKIDICYIDCLYCLFGNGL